MCVRVADLLVWTNQNTYAPRVYLQQKQHAQLAEPSVSPRLCTSLKERQ